MRVPLISLRAILVGDSPGGCVWNSRADDAGVDFFEKKIRPLLVTHCYECHSADAKKVGGGLLLDSREDVRKGGDSGPAVEPGEIDASLLITAIRYTDESVKMPSPKGQAPRGRDCRSGSLGEDGGARPARQGRPWKERPIVG